MEEKQTQQTPVQVIKSIIASNKIMFVTIVMSIVALFTVIDLFVNKPDLGGMAFFGISVGDLFGEEVVAILDTISTIIFVFSIIGALPIIAKAVGFWLIRQGVKDDYASQKGTVFIANPNATTGLCLPLSDIEKLLLQDKNRLVVVDEAYVDFGADSAVKLLSKYDGLKITRLAHGLPMGAQLDYADEMTLFRAFSNRKQVG